MAEKKITKRESYTEIKGILAEMGRNDLAEVMENEIALLDKKTEYARTKRAEKSAIDETLAQAVKEVLGGVEKATITEMQKAHASLNELSNQKVSAIVRKMVDSGEIRKTIDGKKSYFSLA